MLTKLLVQNLPNIDFVACKTQGFLKSQLKDELNDAQNDRSMKILYFDQIWVWEKCPFIGGNIKRVAKGLGGSRKTFPTLHYIYFQKIKKIFICTPCQG